MLRRCTLHLHQIFCVVKDHEVRDKDKRTQPLTAVTPNPAQAQATTRWRYQADRRRRRPRVIIFKHHSGGLSNRQASTNTKCSCFVIANKPIGEEYFRWRFREGIVQQPTKMINETCSSSGFVSSFSSVACIFSLISIHIVHLSMPNANLKFNVIHYCVCMPHHSIPEIFHDRSFFSSDR